MQDGIWIIPYFSRPCVIRNCTTELIHNSAALDTAVTLKWNSDDKIIKSDSAADVLLPYSVLNEKEPR